MTDTNRCRRCKKAITPQRTLCQTCSHIEASDTMTAIEAVGGDMMTAVDAVTFTADTDTGSADTGGCDSASSSDGGCGGGDGGGGGGGGGD